MDKKKKKRLIPVIWILSIFYNSRLPDSSIFLLTLLSCASVKANVAIITISVIKLYFISIYFDEKVNLFAMKKAFSFIFAYLE